MNEMRFGRKEASIYADRTVLSDKIAKDTEEFLKNGKIRKIDVGVTMNTVNFKRETQLRKQPGRVTK